MSGKGDVEKQRKELAAAIDKAGTDPTQLARAIGRSKEYVRDFLEGRKDSMAASAWNLIYEHLGLTIQTGIASEDVRAALEVLFSLICQTEAGAQEAAEVMLKVLSDRQSLPFGVSRDAAIRLSSHQIALQFSRKVQAPTH